MDGYFLIKFDQNGNLVWLRQPKLNCGSHGLSLALDDDNNAYISGDFCVPQIIGSDTLYPYYPCARGSMFTVKDHLKVILLHRLLLILKMTICTLPVFSETVFFSIMILLILWDRISSLQ